MIPFASQRGLGQDLATHLQNEHDNEHMEVAELRGSIAQDLHGAFKEWEIVADALTRCRNYLYSLSVNPDPAQEPLSREQYFDYIARVESALGLTGQPRAIVFHIKEGREHCHVVWSRIDVEQGKAIALSFDHDKLMTLTREFARDHGLTLPDGYKSDGGRQQNGQLSLYELHQQRTTGLTREERMEQVTALWRSSDSPKAFVQALAEHGYILATGNRPYILVDIYGHMNALPKLIDDRTVRLKHIRAFLRKEFPPESLPTVEDAKKLAAAHRRALDEHHEHEQKEEALAELEKVQADRRREIRQQKKAQWLRQHRERETLAAKHRAARDAHRSRYLSQVRAIRRRRRQHRSQGLRALFNRVSGLELIRTKLRRYQDLRRYRAYLQMRTRLGKQQERERRALARRHELQALDLLRQMRALNQIDKRERQSLEESLLAQQRIAARGGENMMPAIRINLADRQPLASYESRNRYSDWLIEAYEQALTREIEPADLEEAFNGAAADDQESGGSGDSSEGPHPRSESGPDPPRCHRRDRDRDKDKGR